MAERLFLRAHDMINNATDPYNSDGVEDGLSLAEVAAASRVFTKQLFDKYKDNPYMLGYMASSKHFNRWVDSVGIDKALEHPDINVQHAAARHPEFNNWVSRVGIDKALEHPSEYVQYGATKHPEFSNWLKQPGNMDKALEHDNWEVQQAAAQHPEFGNWLKQPGNMDKVLEHPNDNVQHAARQAQQEGQQ